MRQVMVRLNSRMPRSGVRVDLCWLLGRETQGRLRQLLAVWAAACTSSIQRWAYWKEGRQNRMGLSMLHGGDLCDL